MQEHVTLSDILEEVRRLKKDVERLEEMIESLIDSTLTPEEEKLLEEVEEDLESGDLSKYIPLEKLDDALREEERVMKFLSILRLLNSLRSFLSTT